jgi:hypothetical protein
MIKARAKDEKIEAMVQVRIVDLANFEILFLQEGRSFSKRRKCVQSR